MRRGHGVLVEAFAARGAPAVEAWAIPGSDAGLREVTGVPGGDRIGLADRLPQQDQDGNRETEHGRQEAECED